ncbi:MAG: hypothetical protein AAGH89_02165 [Verrucomicrobiota bacterium]
MAAVIFALMLETGYLAAASTELDIAVVSSRLEYEESRKKGLLLVHRNYKQQLQGLIERQLKANDLKGANVVRSEMESIDLRIKALESDEWLSWNDLWAGTELPDNSGRIGQTVLGARRNFREQVKKGLVILNRRYLENYGGLQQKYMANADLFNANAINESREALAEELKAIQSSHASPFDDTSPSDVVELLERENHHRWNILKGKWDLAPHRLTGSGDSRIVYHQEIRVPFTLTYEFRVREGMRPRVYVGPFIIANNGYVRQIVLFPRKDGQDAFLYELDDKHKVRFEVERTTVKLFVDDKLIEQREEGIDEELTSIMFSGGDGWSPGTTEYSKIQIR